MERAKELILKYENAGKLGVAVSGGVDSMTLLHLVLSLVSPEKLVVLNMEHGIRGEASLADTELVRSFAQSRGVAFVGRSVSVPELCSKSGRSEETEARLARREFFEDMLSDGVVDFVMLAHNEGDNTESVFMHLLRGSGIKGLIGMQEEDGKFLRPLLSVSREKIERYARENAIPYACDETNDEVKYSRNFLRNEVLPLLRSRYDVDGAIKTLSNNALADETFIRSRLNEEEYIKKTDEGVELEESALSLPSAISSRLIFKAASACGRKCDITSKHIEAVRSLKNSANGKKVEMGGDLVAIKEYGKIVICYQSETPYEEIEFSLGLNSFGDGTVEVYPTEPTLARGKLIIDGDKIPDGSVIRHRKEGDEFKPYGGGSKKLKEYLIDKKIPRRKRDSLPLLCYNNKVLAVFGVEISDEVKITQKTVNAFELKYTED